MLLKNEGVTFVFISMEEFSEFENFLGAVDKYVDKLWKLTACMQVQNKGHTQNNQK